MNKVSVFLLGALTGALALGITACVCETDFTSDGLDDSDENEDKADDGAGNEPSSDAVLIVR